MSDPSQRTSATTLFVYGLLKSGFSGHHLMAGQRFIAAAKTAPNFKLYDCGGFPGLVEAPADPLSVEGELYEVDPECLAALDEFEDVGGGVYARKTIALEGEPAEAQAYVFLRATAGLREVGACWDTKA